MTTQTGFDCFGDCSFWVGYTPDEVGFACRYLSHNPRKNLTRAEAEAISGYGMNVVSVWEAAGNQADYFSATQGREDAVAAMALAQDIGQPEGSCIYFAVDTDVSPDQIDQYILPYFTQVALTLAGHFKVGCYGPGSVCQALKDGSLAVYFWLPNAHGWSGYQTFLNSGAWHIKQGATGDPWGTGVQVDTDESRNKDYGGWSIPQPATM